MATSESAGSTALKNTPASNLPLHLQNARNPNAQNVNTTYNPIVDEVILSQFAQNDEVDIFEIVTS